MVRPSCEALRQWLLVAGRTQAGLAAACGCKQQTISAVARGQIPGSDLRRLLSVATGGVVTEEGWLTATETKRKQAALRRAASFAGGLVASQPEPTQQ